MTLLNCSAVTMQVTVWTTLPTNQQLMSNDNKLWGTILGNKKQKWKDMNSTEHTKKKWVGCSFPQIVYQLHNLATNYPPLKDEGIILHPTFVLFFQHSTVDPNLCFFSLENCNVFACFCNMEYSCWHDLHAGLAAQKINRWLQNIWKNKKESQCRRTLTYAQIIVLELYLARQQIKDGLQHHEKKTDFSYEILQQPSDCFRINLHFWIRYF